MHTILLVCMHNKTNGYANVKSSAHIFRVRKATITYFTDFQW